MFLKLLIFNFNKTCESGRMGEQRMWGNVGGGRGGGSDSELGKV